MAFGDVNLSEEPIRDYQPGAGGWPTIRYFNWATGYQGKPYTKKTGRAMCEELGDSKYMTEYILEAGLTSTCYIDVPSTCNEKARAQGLPASSEAVSASRGTARALSLVRIPRHPTQETKFVESKSSLSSSELEVQIARLKGMASSSMKPELRTWLGQRVAILTQLLSRKAEPKQEL